MTEFARIGVVGAGAWGTALAQTLRRAGRAVRLWAFEPETAESINARHENVAYLPGVALDTAIRATPALEDMADCDLLLMVPPAQHLRAIAARLALHLPSGRPLVICAKGIEQETGCFLADVLRQEVPDARVAVLSGPSFAGEVARGLPAAVTLAADDEALGRAIAAAIGHRAFRPYWTDDLIGVQIGGAVKNVLAIAAGIALGKALGRSAHAALVTRGFAELTRFGTALGARAETLAGLSGLGDLVLTCSSTQSRNMSLGRALGQGERLEDILKARNSVAEGVHTAAAVMLIAERDGLDMPISAAVHAIVRGETSVDAAIEGLLARPFRTEREMPRP